MVHTQTSRGSLCMCSNRHLCIIYKHIWWRGVGKCLLAFVLYLMIFNKILRHFNDCHEGERQ